MTTIASRKLPRFTYQMVLMPISEEVAVFVLPLTLSLFAHVAFRIQLSLHIAPALAGTYPLQDPALLQRQQLPHQHIFL